MTTELHPSPRYDVGGVNTDAPMAVAFQQYKRRRKPVLVSLRKFTDQGNPYIVPALFVDKITKTNGGYLVTTKGEEYTVDAVGNISLDTINTEPNRFIDPVEG
jgi:hypothetical protein